MASNNEEQASYVQQLLNSTAGNFKWPGEVLLYCLPEEQELMPDLARRLTFQTYLSMSSLPFTVKKACNANSMSPEGTAPFVVFHLGNQPLILNFEQLVEFLNSKSLGLGSDLTETERADQEAHLSLIRVRLKPAQQYQTWANQHNLYETLKVSGRGLPWPVSVVLPPLSLLSYVWNYWSTFSRPQDQVLREFELGCNTLSKRLGKEQYFFKSKLSTLDVCVYSHLQAVLSRHLQSCELIKIVQQHENLTSFCHRMSQQITASETSPET